MNKIHETQSTEEVDQPESDYLYTPVPDLQRIEGGGVYKRNSLKLNRLPKGIRSIGYFIVGFSIISFALIIIFNMFLKH